MFDPKKLGEEADQMIAELNQQQAGEAQPAGEDQAAETEAIAQEVVKQPTDDQGVAADSAATTEEPSTQQNAILEEVKQLRKQAEAAEQKWKVLQGMINKKDEELDALRVLFAQMNSVDSKHAQKEAPAPQDFITPEDRKEYGDDLIGMMTKAARAVIAEQMNAIRAELRADVEKLQGSVQHVEQETAKTAQDLFFDALTKRVPNWKNQNVDPGFLNWLQSADEFSGVSRHQLLQHAVSNSDVERAAKFFLAYTAEVSPEAPAEEPEQVEQPTEQPSKRSKVEKFVTPGKARSSAPKVDTGSKRMWSRTEIAKFYDDKMAGRISQKEFEALERDIFAAQHEGRIAA